jgi:hypothetical protein
VRTRTDAGTRRSPTGHHQTRRRRGFLSGADQRGRTRVATVLAALTFVLGGTVGGLVVLPSADAFPNAADEGTHVSFGLEACRLTAGTTLPINGKFVCPEGMYVNGQLGKSWNELDLVPHRLTTTLGSQTAATTDYKVTVAADGINNGKVGYDFISQPVINTDLSHASCTVSGGVTATSGTATQPFGGGTDTVIYQDFIVHQDKGTTCVIDYYQRLALGASGYSGASLQSYMFDGPNLSGSKKTLSIPVNQLAPQELDKDMTASQGSDHMWVIEKGATPANVSFTDTCATDAPLSAAVQVTVSWERLAATPTGPITVSTKVYATNPASRTVTVNVTDVIYSGTTAIHTSPTEIVDVPANTASYLVLEHVTTVPAGTTDLNDIATATYTDKDTGVAIPGQTQATDSAVAQLSTSATNQTATITDVESITGAGLEFSTDGFTGATGTFGGGYVPGTRTTGPVSWTSSSQSGDGSVTFNKTIYAAVGTSVTGSLSDVATINGSDGFQDDADADVTVTAGASVSLTINKTISTLLGAGDSNQTFTFDVTGPGGYTSAPTITFGPGDGGTLDVKSTTLTGLAPGSYTVAERTLAPWAPQPPETVPINLPSCGDSVRFSNTFGLASARVQKVTVPAGSESGWTFNLLRDGVQVSSGTTSGTGFVPFGFALIEGSYTVVEEGRTGFDQTGSSAECTFTVNYPADADRIYSCSYTNTQRGSITITKVTQPSDSTATFTFGGDVAGTLGNGQTATVAVAPGTYTSTETVPSGWDLTSISCDDANSTGNNTTGVATFNVEPGENVICTFTNRQRGRAGVEKTVLGAAPSGSQSFTFELRSGASSTATGTVVESVTAGAINGGSVSFSTALVPGTTYQLCEVVMPGWLTTLGPPLYTVFNPDGDNSTVCTDFTVAAGETKTFAVDNIPPPGGLARTIGFWKNWAACAKSSGKQDPVLDQTLAAAEPSGITIGDLTLHAGDCVTAVAVLNKITTDTGKKVASDPGFNLAAQLLAAQLNVVAGAGVCPAASNAINAAQALLDAKNWNGTKTSVGKLKGSDATRANNLAATLDSYNNNTLC